MPERMPFSGIIRLDPQDSLTADNSAFQAENPAIIDRLLRVGATTHRHDAHTRLANPTLPVVVATTELGGTIPAETTVYVVYTLIDADGGETIANPAPGVVTTQPALVTPSTSPAAVLDTTAGGLLSGNYSYAVTVTDGLGGETTLGPPVDVTIPPGYANARVHVTGLAAIATNAGGTGWRLWKMKDSGGWYMVTFGSADEVIDDGTLCPDCVGRPPTSTSRTNSTSKLRVTVPGSQPAGAVSFNIYATTSVDGFFLSPALLGNYPIAEAGVVKEFVALSVQPGAPPAASQALPGANQINPDTDILDWHWKRPVANAAALPATGNADGDTRVTLDDHVIHVWDDTPGLWFAVGAGAAPGGGGAAGAMVFKRNWDFNLTYPKGSTVRYGLGAYVALIDTLGAVDTDPAAAGPGPFREVNRVTPLDPATAVLASIDNTDPVYAERGQPGEVFTFEVNTAGTVVITTAEGAAPSVVDTYMYLFGANDHTTVLASDNDSGPGAMSEITYAITTPGRYYVLVTAFDATRRGNFSITVTGTTALLDYSGPFQPWSRLSLDPPLNDLLHPVGAAEALSADWEGYGVQPAYHSDGRILSMNGKLRKKSGLAPVESEIIFTLPWSHSPWSTQIQPVVTGDDDPGRVIGWIIIGQDRYVRWGGGKSTDPATKHPYIILDGITYWDRSAG